MYIKINFKRERWAVPGCNSGSFDMLFKKPSYTADLPSDIKANTFSPVRSQFAAKSAEMFCYYLDCGEMTKSEIKLALKLFSQHYKLGDSAFPSVITSLGDQENEIILNMKIAVENAKLAQNERKPYLPGAELGVADDVVKLFSF